MNVESVREYCTKKLHVTEGFPFDDTTLVFKVANKMFALLSLKENPSLNIKCDPDEAIKLREHYDSVMPGYHMNKKLWNTIMLDDTISDKLICDWIDDSYDLIVLGLPKKVKSDLGF